MVRKALIFLMLAAVATIVDADTAKGTFILDGKSYDITSVQARSDANLSDKSRTDVLVLLTDQPVAGTIDIDDLDSLAESGKVHGLLVRIDDQKHPVQMNILGVVQRSGNGICEFEAETFDPTHISGKIYRDEPDESFGRKYIFSIDFDVTVQGSAKEEVAGTPLPADGGEPFQAYQQYEKAIQTADPESLKKFLVPEQAQRLDDPGAGKMLGLMKMMRPQDVVLISGVLQGQRAILKVEGKDPVSETKTSGTVRMIKVDGQWLIEKESWSSL
jgi:hypothetical protein